MSNVNPPPGPGEDPSQQPGGQPPSYGQDPGNQPPSYGQDPGGQPPSYGQQQGGYGQPPQGPPGYYGAPGGYPQQPAKPSPLAITGLVTGILGVLASCFCWFVPVLPIAAAVTGFLGRKQVREDPQKWSGGGMGTAGLVLGIVGIVLSVLFAILVVAFGSFDFQSDFS